MATKVKQLTSEANPVGYVPTVQVGGSVAWALGGGSGSSTFSDRKLFTTTGIDLTIVGATNLYTVPALKTAVITKAIVRITSGVGVLSDATAGIGIAAGEDDIFVAEVLNNTRSVGQTWGFVLKARSRTAPTASIIKLGVDVGATGTLVAAVDLFGYFDDDPSI